MKAKTFRGVYREVAAAPTPVQKFVSDVMRITGASKCTVQSWVTGRRRPGPAARKKIAALLERPETELFPN